jgi:hypothetical protein
MCYKYSDINTNFEVQHIEEFSWGLFHARIATCSIAGLQIAERAHWSLPWKRIATAKARVLQFAILQFCNSASCNSFMK